MFKSTKSEGLPAHKPSGITTRRDLSPKVKVLRELDLNSQTFRRQVVKQQHFLLWKWYKADRGANPHKFFKELTNITISTSKPRKLHFQCSLYPLISNEGLYYISKALQKIKGLKSLVLISRECSTITDKGLTFLGKELKELSHLQSLNLCFVDSKNITNGDLKVLSEG